MSQHFNIFERMRNQMIAVGLFAAASAYGAGTPGSTGGTSGDALKGQAISNTVCVACHGADGNSVAPIYPKLASQHPEYLFKQLRDFKEADGKQPERVNPIMNGMMAAFDEAQMLDLAAYFASLPQKGEQARNRDTIEFSQKLYRAGDAEKGLPACAACHGPTGRGMPAMFPRIGGQYAEYIEAQLKAFREGTRANDPNKMMRMVAIKMTDAEIKAVSDYVAGLR
jgi:cytochrome c553